MTHRFLVGLLLAAVAVAGAAEFPAPFNSGGNNVPPAMTAAEALAALKLPDGFTATVFAAEPDVQNPIGMTWDGRGRLWIAENYTYAERAKKFESGLRDRVLIFEDRNGDGRFSSRRVFIDNVQRLTSVEVGLGGVWLMCPPQLLFVPDRDADGVPDGPATVVLDGFAIPAENYHTFANGLRFGPDGWLYGRCGSASVGELGVPGSPAAERVPMRGTIWRFHPQRKVVEALSAGTTNPWGHDWDRHGELFFINTVNGHLWHGIPGAHYRRGHTLDPNPRTYELIDHHADHWHYDTAFDWTKSRDGAANALGGGHAHGGMMIYQGDNWPAAYRDRLYTLNFHGRRANQERLEREGTGYVGRHEPDFFLSGDPWFRGVELSSGPDGGVFVLDWSDMGECHNANGVNRTTGRIFKIVHGEPRRAAVVDVAQVGGRELAAWQTHANAWFAAQARLELAVRTGIGHPLTHAVEDLRTMVARSPEVVFTLRALWTLNLLGNADTAFLGGLLRHDNEHVRTWAVRLLTDAWPIDTVLGARPAGAPGRVDDTVVALLVELAKREPSGLVRLALGSAVQRLPLAQRVGLAGALAGRAEDANDHNQPLLLWYGLSVLADANPGAVSAIAAQCELPTTRRLCARRLAEDIGQDPGPLNALLVAAAKRSGAFQADIVQGVAEGLMGWRKAPKPAAWEALVAGLSPTTPAAVRERVRDLNVLFGDGRALGDVKALALDGKAEIAARKSALRALIENRPPDLRAICEQLLRVRFLNTVALGGLVLFDDPAVGEKIAAAYPIFHASERAAVIATLVSRPAFARTLLAQVAAGKIPRDQITPFHARQMRSFKDPAVDRALTEAWGAFRESTADKRTAIARAKTEFPSGNLAAGDKGRGRAVFANVCAACHRLYGEGVDIGPDLTGAGRDNLDYLLENILDPSAVVNADYRIAVVKMKDGRTLNGFVAARTARTLTIRSMTESQTIERADVQAIEESEQSMMPDGLFDALNSEQRRDLLAYLMHPTQVPLSEAAP